MKYYVVWEGRQPGIYDNWPDALAQVENFPGAKYKSFASKHEATMAFRHTDQGTQADLARLLLHAASKQENAPRQAPAHPAYGWAVDASCQGNPGRMEYRGVDLATGQELFRIGPFLDGTNNIGEYLALVHALALLARTADARPVYSDSRTAQAWLRNRHSKTTLKPTPRNGKLLELLARADAWVATHSWPNPVVKWPTEEWGEIPADFGRK